MKIPLIAIIGEKEVNENVISIRKQGSKEMLKYNIDDLVSEINKNQ